MTVPVVLVDDHPIVRAGLRAVLSATGAVRVVGEAASADEAVAVIAEAAPKVVLMDLQLGADDGVAATARILALWPDLRVLILTTFDTDVDILRAIEAGACGYLLKDAEPERLADAVVLAASGQTVLAPIVAGRLAARVRSRDEDLTDRELEVLRLVAAGLGNQEIARGLFVSVATVKTHLVHAFRKLGVDNRTAAVDVGRRRGLLR